MPATTAKATIAAARAINRARMWPPIIGAKRQVIRQKMSPKPTGSIARIGRVS
jgi:hypothetical protein